MSLKLAFIKLKNKTKRPIEALKDKLFAFGWYASSFGSVSKAVRYAEIFFKDLSNQQKEMINDTTSSISYGKKGLFWVGNVAASIWALYQITEKESKFGNVVRFLRILANMSSIVFDMVIIAVVNKMTDSILGVVSSGFNFGVNVLNIIKNIRNRYQIAAKLAQPEGLTSVKSGQEDLLYDLNRRNWKIIGRAISLTFGAIVLGLSVMMLLTTNPEIPIMIFGVGIVSLVTRWTMQFTRHQYLNQYRQTLGLEPKLNYMTTQQLREYYLQKLDARNRQFNFAEKNNPADSKQLEEDYRTAKYALVNSIWHDRLFRVDAAMTFVGLVFTVSAVSLVTPLFFLGVLGAGITTAIAKGIMHRARLAELANIKPELFEADKSESDEQKKTVSSGATKRLGNNIYQVLKPDPQVLYREEEVKKILESVKNKDESRPIATWHKGTNGVRVITLPEEQQRAQDSLFVL